MESKSRITSSAGATQRKCKHEEAVDFDVGYEVITQVVF